MKLINKFKNSDFLKSITVLASGSIIAQIINILASPITTRLFSPEELGAYTLIMTAVSIFGPIINLRYDLSIVMENDENKVYSLVKSSFYITFIMSIIVVIGYAIYYTLMNQFQNIIINLIIIFILLVLTGIINILNAYNNRLKEYNIITSVYVRRTIGQVSSMIISGFLKLGYIGLMLSQIIGQVLGLKKQSLSLKKSINKVLISSNKDLIDVCIKHKKQLITVPSTFFNSFSYSSINIFIDILYGKMILGFYSMSFRILGLPLSIIASNVSKIYFEEASREYESTNGYKNAFNKTFWFLLFLSIIMCICLVLFAPMLFGVFFGDQWTVAGVYVQILAPLFSIRLVSTALGPALLIVGKQKIDLLLQICLILISISDFILVSYLNLSINIFLAYFSFLASLVYIFAIYLAYYYSKPNNNF